MPTPIAELEATFVERGWVVVDLARGDVVAESRGALLAHLQTSGLPELERLEDYHEHVDDDRHEATWYELATWYWASGLSRRTIDAELPFLRRFVGLDLHVQRYPYLRIARPAQPGDVTGIHRDTYYGASPYEVSIVVPFTELDADSALRVVSGSHLEAAEQYPATRVESETVKSGSPRHQLGFPYAPQLLDPEVATRAEPVPLQVGQALLMSLGLVHGQVENTSATTRFTTDVRVVNSLAPVAFGRGVRADYYEPLCSSPVTEQARRHLERSDAARDD